MKSYLIAAALLLASVAAPAADMRPPEKVLNTFNQLFHAAREVRWRYTKELCEANFYTAAARYRVSLDYNGNLIRTIRYYKRGLPPLVLHKIHKKFGQANLHGVTEISDAEGTRYEIILYEEDRMLRLTVTAGGTVLHLRRFKRAS